MVSYDRLERLATVIEELPPGRWNFGVVTSGYCSQATCAIGWAMVEFAAECRRFPGVPPWHTAQHVLGLDTDTMLGLFQPDVERDWAPTTLRATATAAEVADGIRGFIAWHRPESRDGEDDKTAAQHRDHRSDHSAESQEFATHHARPEWPAVGAEVRKSGGRVRRHPLPRATACS